jgi:nitroreductase
MVAEALGLEACSVASFRSSRDDQTLKESHGCSKDHRPDCYIGYAITSWSHNQKRAEPSGTRHASNDNAPHSRVAARPFIEAVEDGPEHQLGGFF